MKCQCGRFELHICYIFTSQPSTSSSYQHYISWFITLSQRCICMAIKLMDASTNHGVSNYTIRISCLFTSGRFRRSNYIAPPVVICPPPLLQGHCLIDLQQSLTTWSLGRQYRDKPRLVHGYVIAPNADIVSTSVAPPPKDCNRT